MTASLDRLHLFGIRHHGPGSARAVVAALKAADPAIVLIEGPPDADAMIAFAASPDMVPPVALLVHDEADPSQSSFYPFAAYSPEWQAMRWALQHARPVRFIDLPMANQLAVRAAKESREAETPETETPQTETGAGSEALPATEAGGAAGEERTAGETDPAAAAARDIQRDPLGALAKLAGYEDGEAWWNALIEQGSLVEQGSPAEQGSPVEPSSTGRADHAKSEAPHEPAASGIFAAIETAMTELRAYADAHPSRSPAEQTREDQREAHMRLAIAAALKETDAAVAVVCGAWHIPALRKKVALADDRARLKGLPKTKVVATWVPWTDTRLASGSGYGAGVESP